MHRSFVKRAGFTLIEMLTVVLIIGILVAVAMPQYRRLIQRSRAAEAVTMLRVLADSAERLATSFGHRKVSGFAGENAEQFVFSRLDMISKNTIACSLSGKKMICDNFTYQIHTDGTISATQTSTNVVLTVHPDLTTASKDYITCTGDSDLCELYGYDSDINEGNEEE